MQKWATAFWDVTLWRWVNRPRRFEDTGPLKRPKLLAQRHSVKLREAWMNNTQASDILQNLRKINPAIWLTGCLQNCKENQIYQPVSACWHTNNTNISAHVGCYRTQPQRDGRSISSAHMTLSHQFQITWRHSTLPVPTISRAGVHCGILNFENN
jgi:hypothetical protein